MDADEGDGDLKIASIPPNSRAGPSFSVNSHVPDTRKLESLLIPVVPDLARQTCCAPALAILRVAYDFGSALDSKLYSR